ncbi:MAG: TIGR02221 family CRISPR-associated protein [Mediterranea sp.]|jgi:CRISPR-associated Csx2 family protein|nr:TIGR02221 family CRISPR-associated protein [Mediterranea sp.]
MGKVFISFLGSSLYGKCTYQYGEFKSTETRFVQQATIEWIMQEAEWAKEDKAFILVTGGNEGSKVQNWDNTSDTRMQRNPQTCKNEAISYPRLEKVISDMNLPFKTKPVLIADGKDEKEIWEIFKEIVKLIEDRDELYLDLTHGFRYLPMLLLVLGNYLKLLKKVQVKHISYGNYEARDKANNAPFVNLLPFSALQDWTMAAKSFVKYGKVEELREQLSVNRFKEEYRNESEEVNAAYGIDFKLKKLSAAITFNKLDTIREGIDMTKEMNALSQEHEILPEPFFPLIKEVEDKVSTFKQGTLENVFAATNWCIRHEMYQNAYSILLEGVISIILDSLSIPYKENKEVTPQLLAEDYRQIVTYVANFKTPKKDKGGNPINKDIDQCLKGFSFKSQGKEFEIKDAIRKVWGSMDEDLCKSISSLSTMRNAYMHAGTGTNPLGPDNKIKTSIEESYKSLYKKLYREKGDESC